MDIHSDSLSILKYKSILITGGAGFIGSHLSDFFRNMALKGLLF